MNCRLYERRSVGIPNDTFRCWTCNQVGHIAATCHTLRCYTCSGFGHKAQECASQRSQPRRSPSYTSARRTSEPWKKTNAGRFEDQKTKAYSQGHSQAWRHEVDQRSVEVPTAQLGVGHAAMLTTLLHIIV